MLLQLHRPKNVSWLLSCSEGMQMHVAVVPHLKGATNTISAPSSDLGTIISQIDCPMSCKHSFQNVDTVHEKLVRMKES